MWVISTSPRYLKIFHVFLVALLNCLTIWHAINNSLQFQHLGPLILKALSSILEKDALDWVSSYLSGRTQSISIAEVKSPPQTLVRGVPQGSVLGPIFFTIYTLPLGDTVRKYGMKSHLFADNTQLYLTFDPKAQGDEELNITTMESCISEIKLWMLQNKLNLNDGKMEFLFLKSHHNKTHDANKLVVTQSAQRQVLKTWVFWLTVTSHCPLT